MNAPCDNCDAVTTVTIEPYGSGKMAVINCPECGTSYDTNLDPVEGENSKDYCAPCGQVAWLCICKGEGENEATN